jgi:hypothetical protein
VEGSWHIGVESVSIEVARPLGNGDPVGSCRLGTFRGWIRWDNFEVIVKVF